ncbi:MAG TPA: type II toxin-antitoxin system VapC family toxin [Candidatus Nitrosocosmicus sp.]|nr:type II toxin-antitoxin system VapC family toxin [Candidatus Nitrosocosmicus sp.]
MVDASVAVQWFAREPGSEASAALVEGNQPLVAPDIMPLEVANALWKKFRRGDVPAGDLQPAVTRILASDITLIPTLNLLERAVRLAFEISHPVYDCVYLVLAEERGAPLASIDERLRAAARARGLRVWRP